MLSPSQNMHPYRNKKYIFGLGKPARLVLNGENPRFNNSIDFSDLGSDLGSSGRKDLDIEEPVVAEGFEDAPADVEISPDALEALAEEQRSRFAGTVQLEEGEQLVDLSAEDVADMLPDDTKVGDGTETTTTGEPFKDADDEISDITHTAIKAGETVDTTRYDTTDTDVGEPPKKPVLSAEEGEENAEERLLDTMELTLRASLSSNIRQLKTELGKVSPGWRKAITVQHAVAAFEKADQEADGNQKKKSKKEALIDLANDLGFNNTTTLAELHDQFYVPMGQKGFKKADYEKRRLYLSAVSQFNRLLETMLKMTEIAKDKGLAKLVGGDLQEQVMALDKSGQEVATFNLETGEVGDSSSSEWIPVQGA